MSASFELPDLDVFTTGAIGAPGHRVFYVQARTPTMTITLRLEKQQVAALGQYLQNLLADLPHVPDPPDDDSLELVEPLVPEWVVGTLGVAYDADEDRVLLAADELVATDDEGNPGPDVEQATARFRLTRAQAAAFSRRAVVIVEAGRPPCRLCGRPMDPEGHICPRTNGHGVH